jgi:cysteinyl-tRNA synthetase
MNITNVDDKILARSKERNIPALQLAEYYEREFWRDMDALNVMRPTIVTRVTDHVESSIIPYIQRIMDNGMAYRIDNDGVYFDVNKFEQRTMGGRYYGGKTNRYGKLAPGRMETLFAWGGMNHGNGPKKKDPRDFVLWKNRKVVSSSSTDNDQDVDHDHEQEDLLWDSPWGRGRPGWHIECSAMIESTMQLDFMRDHYKMQVHAGGIDLKFPHHTNEIAQAEAYHSKRQGENGHVQDGECDNGEEWIPHWVHTGHLHIDGLKMSKSLKNFITIRELLEEKEGGSDLDGGSLEWLHSPADDFRLWCLGLSGSYRGPATYSKSRLVQARIVREKMVRFLVDGEQWVKRKMSCSSSSLTLSSSTFTAGEFDLMQQSNKCQMTCLKIIFGLEKNLDNHHHDHLEFDGSAYLNALIDLSDAGNKYIAAKSAGTTNMMGGESSTVAVQQALGVLRECLAIVGFSDKTVRAGIFETAGSDNHNQEHIYCNSKLVQELVNFRKAVRELALEQVKQRGQGENVAMPHNSDFAKHLLTLCDKLRDEDLPKVGIEVFDSVGQDTLFDWRFIIPRDVTTHHNDDNVGSEPSKNLHLEVTITESNFFKVGRYEGQFSAFDDHDFPTHDANGVELSKRMIKKLLKKKLSYFENKS